jgi:hypothetical protein
MLERFELRLTRAEKAALQELAQRRGVSQGDVIRGMIRRAHRALR